MQASVNTTNPFYYLPNLPGGKYATNRLALVCNNASLTENDVPVRVAILQNGYQLVKLFSPEHGLTATGEDGALQPDGIDPLTGLPVISLYGNSMIPKKEDLLDIDLVIFDIPDIGCRFYTYLWTLTYAMDACAASQVLLIIADRPNPTGGNLSQAEGPMLDETSCASFIGRWRIPVRHCCTMGELALYFAATKISGLNLQIIPANNWQRCMPGNKNFTPTSPAMQKRSTALLYPGMGLLEGINVNEGRGTALPFEIFGAPWIDAIQLQQSFLASHQPGITSTPTTYIPTAGLYAGESCNGLYLSVTDEAIFKPVQTGIALLSILFKLYPASVKERLYCTMANPSGTGHLDKLLGVPNAISKIIEGQPIKTAVAAEWADIMQDYLLYE
jgi:uncharacterized protein YbbC (DUF1343 family)